MTAVYFQSIPEFPSTNYHTNITTTINYCDLTISIGHIPPIKKTYSKVQC